LLRIDAVWMANEPPAMGAGPQAAMARVVHVFGAPNRMKLLVHDGVGVWLAARRLNSGKFVWGDARLSPRLPMNAAQLSTLALGLPRNHLAH
jgi:transposase